MLNTTFCLSFSYCASLQIIVQFELNSFYAHYAVSPQQREDESYAAPMLDVINIPSCLQESCIIPDVEHGVKKYERRRKCRHVYFRS